MLCNMSEGQAMNSSDCIQAIIAVLTLMAVLVALFGDWLKARMFKPSLGLSLTLPKGEAVKMRTPDSIIETPARYYHLLVTNHRGFPAASDVAVYLTASDFMGANGQYRRVWTGEVPLRWRHQELYPLFRTIGPAIDCDLVCIMKGNGVSLMPIMYPNNLQVHWTDPFDMMLTVVVRHREGESKPYRIKIVWDGKWHDGESELAQHFQVIIIDVGSM